jgi:uncharacterized membrane protein
MMVNRKALKRKSKEQLRGQWKIPVLVTLVISIIEIISSYVMRIFVDNIPVYILLSILNLFIIFSIGIMINSFYLKISRGKHVKFSDMLIPWKTYGNGLVIQFIVILMCIPVIFIICIIMGVMLFYANYITMSSLAGNLTPYSGYMIVFMTLLILILCIPIIILELYLFPAVILVCEDNNRGIIQCIKESFKLMKGNLWSLFVLHLSFIGWAILCIIPAIFVAIMAMFSFNNFVIAILPTIAAGGFLWLAPYINTTLLNFFNEISEDTNNPSYNEIHLLY